jgi:hypothetical protein
VPRLNLPILELLEDCQHILIAGGGGGFDVFGALPLYFTLKDAGKTVHLANYSFSDFRVAQIASQPIVLLDDLLIGARGKVEIPLSYFPEGYLAEWFQVECGDDITIWMFAKVGVVPLTTAYRKLASELGIDAVIVVDGGVDSLMRGDEAWAGSLVGDAISLAAVDSLDAPVKILACVGFGTEIEDMVGHHHVLENIAALAKMNAFLGSCALVPEQEVFQRYESALRYVWQQADHQKGHIHSRIVPATHGEFDDYHEFPDDRQVQLFLSPLMNLYWFFDLPAVVQRNLFIAAIQSTQTSDQAKDIYEHVRLGLKIRAKRSIPY